MAELNRFAREYIHWPILEGPADVDSWSALINGEWLPLERQGDTLRLLLEGPDVLTPRSDVVTLTRTADNILILASDDPEDIPRDGGTIRLI